MAITNSKKLDALCRWAHIGTVNEKLDSGENPNKVYAWITSAGFKISLPMVYEYAKRRKQAIVTDILSKQNVTVISAEPCQGVRRVPIVNPRAVAIKRLKSELDALEAVIQLGYQTLCNLPAGEITPKLMLEAIALKNKITEGAYGNLTEFGLYHLKELEDKKITQIAELFFRYIPQDKRDEVIAAMEAFEDDFYIHTDYYTEYLKAKAQH